MVCQRAFNHVKTTITRVLAYPDYSKVFESYTDTSSNELGIVIGAAFIKKLVGSKKKQRKFHVFFFKLVFGDQNKS